jgi:hypothetical protein
MVSHDHWDILWILFSGIGTLLGTILIIVSTLLDLFPRLHARRGLVTMCVCFALFIIGLPLTSQVIHSFICKVYKM